MPTSAYTPTLADVGSLVLARTKDTNGNVLGTFNANTRPTDAQVTALVENAVFYLAARFGADLDDDVVEAAKEVAALRAAMLVELSYFGDQITVGRGPYTELKTLYDEAWGQLVENVKLLGGDEEPGTDDDLSAAGLPSYAFRDIGSPLHVPGAEVETTDTWMRW